MTAVMDPAHMPGLMDADAAAKRVVRAIRAGTKVYNFPWRVALMVKLSRWVPDRLMNWVMGDYNEQAPKQLGLEDKKPPAA
jgi:hypothetical protein